MCQSNSDTSSESECSWFGFRFHLYARYWGCWEGHLDACPTLPILESHSLAVGGVTVCFLNVHMCILDNMLS